MRFSVLIRELKVAPGESDDYPSRMIVQPGLFMRAVMDIRHLNGLVCKSQRVMFGFGFEGTLGVSGGER